jgi:hypothetical protein
MLVWWKTNEGVGWLRVIVKVDIVKMLGFPFFGKIVPF